MDCRCGFTPLLFYSTIFSKKLSMFSRIIILLCFVQKLSKTRYKLIQHSYLPYYFFITHFFEVRAVALPALEDSGNLIDRYIKGKTKPVKLKHKNGFRFQFDCIIEDGGKSLLCVFPHSFDERITKEQMDHYLNVAAHYSNLCDKTSLVVFSVNRFSDWCVHQASLFNQVFCVTAERLRY